MPRRRRTRITRCSFCGREPTTRRDLVTGARGAICVGCVIDAVHSLLLPEDLLATFASSARDSPCTLCERAHWSSALRLSRDRGVICAPCIASATRLFELPTTARTPRIPPGLAAELRRGAAALARAFPELAMVFAWTPRPGDDTRHLRIEE